VSRVPHLTWATLAEGLAHRTGLRGSMALQIACERGKWVVDVAEEAAL
jgi:hypothetical protein